MTEGITGSDNTNNYVYKINLPQETKQFSTKDIYFAAAILATSTGILEHVDRTDKRRMKFYFSGDYDVFADAELGWTNRTGKWKILAEFADSIRAMKSEIHRDDK